MKPDIDVAFWNERARQPECLSLIKYNNVGCVILPYDQLNHNKLIEQWQERMQRERRI